MQKSNANASSIVYLRCRCVALLDVLQSTPGYPLAGGAPRCRPGYPAEGWVVPSNTNWYKTRAKRSLPIRVPLLGITCLFSKRSYLAQE